MTMAKATMEEWQALADWFAQREADGKEVPQWRRTVFGYRVLVDNACDPDKHYLDWKPGIIVQELTPPDAK